MMHRATIYLSLRRGNGKIFKDAMHICTCISADHVQLLIPVFCGDVPGKFFSTKSLTSCTEERKLCFLLSVMESWADIWRCPDELDCLCVLEDSCECWSEHHVTRVAQKKQLQFLVSVMLICGAARRPP